MTAFPIGVLIDSFKAELRRAVELAAQVGVTGIQVFSTQGDMAPEAMTPQKRREFLDLVKSHGLVISALCGDLGEGGFTDPAKNPFKIERSKRILDLAKELETNVVTTHIGVVPQNSQAERYQILQEACGTLAEYANSLRAHFAIETGPETASTLKGFLDSLGSRGVAVNMDPANLVMVTGDDPAQAVITLQEYIVHTHAKDGKRLWYRDPEEVYGMVKSAVVTSPSYREVPLGDGQVDWRRYLEALDHIGYKGFLTIEREVGDEPYGDIAHAVEFLHKFF